MWYFERIPEEERPVARNHYEQGQLPELMNIYNKYKVSPTLLTPCCSINKTIEWTKWAIHKGIL